MKKKQERPTLHYIPAWQPGSEDMWVYGKSILSRSWSITRWSHYLHMLSERLSGHKIPLHLLRHNHRAGLQSWQKLFCQLPVGQYCTWEASTQQPTMPHCSLCTPKRRGNLPTMTELSICEPCAQKQYLERSVFLCCAHLKFLSLYSLQLHWFKCYLFFYCTNVTCHTCALQNGKQTTVAPSVILCYIFNLDFKMFLLYLKFYTVYLIVFAQQHWVISHCICTYSSVI